MDNLSKELTEKNSTHMSAAYFNLINFKPASFSPAYKAACR